MEQARKEHAEGQYLTATAVAQSLGCVQLFVAPWTVQALLSFTISHNSC